MATTSGRLNFSQLATLAEFGRLGTLAAVAEALGYTPGAVSQQMSALERSVGRPLVERSGRQLVLTDAGHVLVAHAESLIEAERAARLAVAALGSDVAGPLRVGTWGSMAATLLAPVVAELGRRHPEVTVRSKEVDLDEAASEVRRGTVDVAFGLDYPSYPLPPERGIDFLELLEEPFAVVLARRPEGLPAGREVRAADLADLGWILPPATSHFGAALRVGFRRRGLEPRVVHEVTDTAASLLLAAGGLGATVMTPLMRRLTPATELEVLHVADPLTRRIVLLAPSDRTQRTVTSFVEVVSSVVRSLTTPGADAGPGPTP
ncbi:LysR family transcriptional regulator [Nocardioides sp. GY 10127]|uniref:LysR family transcriptional regulator n=1 Tax=Nocardioides sp. GY 10127 TaxID=2569762 RepID=UPI0010A8F67B|nr:LysR family transcriptional regulator [Nocardioides sp. GY 10127]TIC81700.1 LysR family transcriptional regulator [Nocardioides sp. GY 10127]